MREIRTSSSEGGGAKSIVSPYPYHRSRERAVMLAKLVVIVAAFVVVAWVLGELLRQRRPRGNNRRHTER